MVEEDPGDPFSRYGLAMELKSLGRVAEALSEFASLKERAPDYVATYYQYGSLLHAEGQQDQAVKVIEAGIAKASASGDSHTKSELEDLLDEVQG